MSSKVTMEGTINDAFFDGELIESNKKSTTNIGISEECGGTNIDNTIIDNKNRQNEIIKNGNIQHGKKDSYKISEENSEQKPRLRTQIAATIMCGIIQLSFGIVFGFTGTIAPALTDVKSNDIVFTISELSWFSSVASIGAIIGGLLSNSLMPLLGQRVCILIVLPFGVISSITLGMTSEFWILLLCRIVQGVVVIISSSCAFSYLSEISHKSIRQRLIGVNEITRKQGFVMIFSMGSRNLSWRTVAIFTGVIPMVIPFIGFVFLPNSPRWLATKGHNVEAAKALSFFMGENYDCDTEMNEITKQITQLNIGIKKKLTMFLNKSIFIKMFLSIILTISIIYSGKFVILAYSALIFESTDVDISPYLSTILIGVIRVVVTHIYIKFGDKLDKKPLMAVSSFLAGISIAIFGLHFYLKTALYDMSSVAWLPLVSLLFFYIFITISTEVMELYISELIPTPIRDIATSFLYTIFSIASFTLTLTYFGMVDTIGSHWTFWIFAMNCFFMAAITVLFTKETRNKSLELTLDINETNK